MRAVWSSSASPLLDRTEFRTRSRSALQWTWISRSRHLSQRSTLDTSSCHSHAGDMRHGSKSPPSLRVKPTVLRWDGSRFMKTSVWCFIRADSRVIWIFKARCQGWRRHSSLSVAESCEGKETDKGGQEGTGGRTAHEDNKIGSTLFSRKPRRGKTVNSERKTLQWSKLKVPYYTKVNLGFRPLSKVRGGGSNQQSLSARLPLFMLTLLPFFI